MTERQEDQAWVETTRAENLRRACDADVKKCQTTDNTAEQADNAQATGG